MKQVIKIDADLEELFPVYLKSKRDELARIPLLLETGDLDAVRVIGHKMRGSGGGYGLDFLTDLGERMENSASAGDKTALAAQAAELKDFLDSLVIEFVRIE